MVQGCEALAWRQRVREQRRHQYLSWGQCLDGAGVGCTCLAAVLEEKKAVVAVTKKHIAAYFTICAHVNTYAPAPAPARAIIVVAVVIVAAAAATTEAKWAIMATHHAERISENGAFHLACTNGKKIKVRSGAHIAAYFFHFGLHQWNASR